MSTADDAGLTPEDVAAIRAEINALRDEFLENSAEKMAQFAGGLAGLEEQPDNVGHIDTLLRIVHSLKGNGGTFGLPALSAIADALGAVLDEVGSGKRRPTAQTISALRVGAAALQLVIRQPDAVTEQTPEIVTALASLKTVTG